MTRDPYPGIRQFIDGAWKEGEGPSEETVFNPATGEALTTFRHVGSAQLDRALGAVDRAAVEWRNTPPLERSIVIRRAAQFLRERADSIAYCVSLEQGKPVAEARAEVFISADVIEWCAEEGRRTYGRIVPSDGDSRLMVTVEPVGPVAAFTPWNFPVLTVARKIGPALAAGCSIVVKASEETPAGATAVVAAFEDAGAPRGVLNLVLGVPSEISARLMTAGIIRKVSLTGSVAVGRVLSHLAADNHIRTTMELGGNAPVIVEPDVDIDEVALRCATSKYRNAGQVCNSPSRFFVHEDVHDQFVTAVQKFAENIVVGNGTDPETTMGPLANTRRVQYIASVISHAVARGATLVSGGSVLQGPGNFVQPTILTDIAPGSKVFDDEVFGPVMPIVRYNNLSDAIEMANATTYGLAAFAFTSSMATGHRIARDIEAGIVGLNTTVVSRAETPFGGVRASGHGFESGMEGVDVFTRRKAVLEHDPVAPGTGVSH